MNVDKAIAIIPARKNSKGVKDKNLRLVGGKSLVSRAINAARSAGIEKVIVSTDGEDIAKEAIDNGAVVVKRPSELATDAARSIDAVIHVLDKMQLYQGVAVLLQPTSPLRNELDVVEALKLFSRDKAASVISVTECEHHPYKSIILSDGKLHPIMTEEALETPRQLLPPAYRINGAVYVNDIAALRENRNFFAPPLSFHIMPPERSIDIDTQHDLELANGKLGEVE